MKTYYRKICFLGDNAFCVSLEFSIFLCVYNWIIWLEMIEWALDEYNVPQRRPYLCVLSNIKLLRDKFTYNILEYYLPNLMTNHGQVSFILFCNVLSRKQHIKLMNQAYLLQWLLQVTLYILLHILWLVVILIKHSRLCTLKYPPYCGVKQWL